MAPGSAAHSSLVISAPSRIATARDAASRRRTPWSAASLTLPLSKLDARRRYSRDPPPLALRGRPGRARRSGLLAALRPLVDRSRPARRGGAHAHRRARLRPRGAADRTRRPLGADAVGRIRQRAPLRGAARGGAARRPCRIRRRSLVSAYTPTRLAQILAKHALWLSSDPAGARAYLSGADLSGANLSGANLSRAYLSDADLSGADLSGAYLSDADLSGANLSRANLSDAYLSDADLSGANLSRANLSDADLSRAYLSGANLSDAYLSDASIPIADPPESYRRAASDEERETRRLARMLAFREQHPEVPVIENLDARILAAISQDGCRLDMATWHGCETTHCRAGWAIHLAGPAGYELERATNARQAGAAIYRASTGRVPHFFATNERAIEDLKRCAAKQASL